ncbi:primase-helicase family protein [Chryseobacterium arthrosphaerae]
MSFPIDQDQIFEATNGGWDLIERFLPEANIKKYFKIRKEGTESANVSKQSGIYFVKDWGDAGGFFSKSKHGIHIYSHFTGKTYFESLISLGEELGIIDKNKTLVKNVSVCKFHDYNGVELNDDGFGYITKDFTPYELEILGPLVTPEICKKYSLYSLESYSWVKKDENTQREFCDVVTVTNTPTYPILAFIISEGGGKPKLSLHGPKKDVKVEPANPAKEWLKIYQPKSPDKKYRFSYLGKKPKQHIFGLDILKQMTEKEVDVRDDEGHFTGTEKATEKVKKVVICSGDRDSINMASTGKADAVVWFNSETADITESQIGLLFKYAVDVINVPDLDPTGVEAGKKIAIEHMDVKTAWLPEEITKRKDFRGNPFKDFTDFMKINSSYDDDEQSDLKKKVERFLELARPAKFWSSTYNKNRNTVDYKVNYKNAFNFLKLNGFFRIKDEKRKDGYYFVKQDKHILKEVSAQEIKDFFNNVLDQKQKEKGLALFPDDLLNMLIGSEAVSDKKLVNLETKDFDFTDHTYSTQYLFFDKFIWEVKADRVEEISKGYSRYVMESDILNNIIKKQTRHELNSREIKIEANYVDGSGKIIRGNPFFEITKDENNNWKVDIFRKDCDFMNYLINASRVYWKEEVKELPRSKWEDYLKEHNFSLDVYKTDGSITGLDDDQVYEQELHFANKAFTYGYLLHRFKDPSKAWCVYAMDNEVVDDNESHGRTGKSLLFNNAVRLFMNSKYMGARKKNLLDSDFLYDGITEQTDYVLFDDADKKFQFNQLFTDITGDLNVNPKNQNAYLIPFHQSPKFCITTNYAPFGLDSSTMERILFVSYADWYHGAKEDMEARSPLHDFQNRFFTEWDDKQWNLFLNFSVQCLQFYLSTKDKIGAPQGNIKKRNLITEMGTVFLEWAEGYFVENKLNDYVVKKDAQKDLIDYNTSMKNISATLFKKKLEQFCELKGYVLNPKDKAGKDGRIIQSAMGISFEAIYIAASEIELNPLYPEAKNPQDEDPYNVK